MPEVKFSVESRPVRSSRYTVSNARPTAEGGSVGVGVDTKGNAYLVHEIGRATEAVALGAVATAIAGGAVPVSAVVGAFAETNQLAQLRKELDKLDPQAPPSK